MISVIDYGMGNIGSVLNMINKIGAEGKVITTPEDILSAKKLLLPGVGSFDAGMISLSSLKLDKAIINAVCERSVPILGICLGMQLLLNSSEEGNLPGLGLINGTVKKFDSKKYKVKIPHMGWNTVQPAKNSVFFNSEDVDNRFYFVHSYYVECADIADASSYAVHGNKFVASLEKGLIFGAQFHPEKSHKFGMALLKKFAELEC